MWTPSERIRVYASGLLTARVYRQEWADSAAKHGTCLALVSGLIVVAVDNNRTRVRFADTTYPPNRDSSMTPGARPASRPHTPTAPRYDRHV